jgi:hypothetical protein
LKATPIYRVIPAGSLEEIVSTRAMKLRRLTLWDDPFENVLMRVHLRCLDTGLRLHVGGILDNFFGLCWTTNGRETDAFWRIYAPNGNSVRISSTTSRLWQALYQPTDKFAALKYALGRVRYVSQAALVAFLTNPANVADLIFDSSGKRIGRWLLLKRLEFKHEREVRFLYRDVEHHLKVCNYKRFRIDPNAVITAVTCDPRMPVPDFRNLRSRLRAHGFTGPIRLSKLYRLPIRHFKLDCSG